MSEYAKIQNFECLPSFYSNKIEKFFEIFKCTLIYYIKLIRTNNLTAQKHVCIYENYNNKL